MMINKATITLWYKNCDGNDESFTLQEGDTCEMSYCNTKKMPIRRTDKARYDGVELIYED